MPISVQLQTNIYETMLTSNDSLSMVNVTVIGQGLLLTQTEYVQLLVNAVVLVLGLPLNILALCQVSARYVASRSRIFLLYLSLNLSDLLVIVIYSGVRSVWIITFKWMFGDFLCRMFKFTEALSFAISANIVTCIAFDRLYCLRQPFKAESLKRVRKWIAVAWFCALFTAAPQLLTWTAPSLSDTEFGDLTQCISIWRYSGYLNSSGQNDQIGLLGQHMVLGHVYSLYISLMLFWLPLLLLAVSYACILREVDRRSGTILEKVRRTLKRPTDSQLSVASTASRNEQGEGLRRVCGTVQVQRSRTRTLRITLMLVTIFIICWLPYNCMELWLMLDEASFRDYGQKLYFLKSLIVFNSIINPLVYMRMQLCARKRPLTSQSQPNRSNVINDHKSSSSRCKPQPTGAKSPIELDTTVPLIRRCATSNELQVQCQTHAQQNMQYLQPPCTHRHRASLSHINTTPQTQTQTQCHVLMNHSAH